MWVHWHIQLLHVLHWQQPGAVWALDYARPPALLAEGFADLPAVRDLASGLQLLWLPVPQATAAHTVAAVLPVFLLYGAPLVVKMDNGSPLRGGGRAGMPAPVGGAGALFAAGLAAV
jgi:hypothetical protein